MDGRMFSSLQWFIYSEEKYCALSETWKQSQMSNTEFLPYSCHLRVDSSLQRHLAHWLAAPLAAALPSGPFLLSVKTFGLVTIVRHLDKNNDKTEKERSQLLKWLPSTVQRRHWFILRTQLLSNLTLFPQSVYLLCQAFLIIDSFYEYNE